MKHLFIPYKLAIKLKNLSFTEPCFGKFLTSEVPENRFRFNTEGSPKDYNTENYGRFISAPLYQQVVDWFREKHSIIINAVPDESLQIYCGKVEDKDGFIETEDTSSYYEALAKAIEESLKLIKQ